MPLGAEVFVPGLVELLKFFRDPKVPVEAVLRALLLECEANLGILRLVDLERDSQEPNHQDPVLHEVALLLRSDALDLVMGGTSVSEKVTARLRRVRFVIPEDAAEVLAPGIEVEMPSVEEGIRRVVVAVRSVQGAAHLLRTAPSREPSSSRLRNIRMRQRLQNVSRSYTEIAKALRTELGVGAR